LNETWIGCQRKVDVAGEDSGNTVVERDRPLSERLGDVYGAESRDKENPDPEGPKKS
jgi:hypothetical protein